MKFIKTSTPIIVFDVGAADLDNHQDVIQKLPTDIDSVVYGFEPNKSEFDKLIQSDRRKYFNVAIGDGTLQTFNVYAMPGMNSFLRPNVDYINLFHGFDQWAKIVESHPMQTHKLDDLELDVKIDFCKIDVQGMESEVIASGLSKLSQAVCIQVELSPHPLYMNEKPFSHVCRQLEDIGFQLDMFSDIHTRPFKPMTILPNNPYVGLHHLFQMDCVFIRRFPDLLQLGTDDLAKTIQILHHCYGSIDLVDLLVRELSARTEAGSEHGLLALYREDLKAIKIAKRY